MNVINKSVSQKQKDNKAIYQSHAPSMDTGKISFGKLIWPIIEAWLIIEAM